MGALVLAYAYLAQGVGSNQNSHHALVRALASGTAVIDQTRYEVGDLGTRDVSRVGGRFYSDKAPGLVFASLPAYVVLREAGTRTSGDPSNVLWALGLWAVVLPAGILLLLVRGLAERVAPGLALRWR